MSNTTYEPETAREKHTLRSLALAMEEGDISLPSARKTLSEIMDAGFTEAYFDTEDPNKMIFRGNPDNSLLTLDRMAAERSISRQTWRAVRDIIDSMKASGDTADK